MPHPELVPALSEAEQLAEAVKAAPNQLIEQQIAGSSLDQLDAAAKVIEEKRIVIDGQARALIRARFEILKALETTDQQLAGLSSRVHLMRLLEVRAPVSATPSSMDTVAGVLRNMAENTKEVPVLKNVTGLFKDLKGRTIERVWYNVLALFEKNPVLASTAAGATMGPMGSLLGLLNFNFGGRRKLLSFDVLDAIDAERLVGETITFNGIAAGDMEKFKDKLATANIADLTTTYIRDQRKLVPAGTPITVTLEAILSPEQTQTKLDEQQTETKKKAIAEQFQPIDISLVSFGTPVAARKYGAGFEITIPDKDDAVSSPEVRKLQEAMATLVNAKDITIVSEREHLTLDLVAKSALIPVNTTITESINRGFSYTNARLEKIVFATPSELPINTMQAKFDSGTLLLGANASRTQALEQISGLDSLLESANNGDIFVFNDGSWTGSATQPTPIPTP